MDSNSTINRDYNFDFNIENNHENNINEELEIRWKEIEDITEQKLNKNRESKKLNFLNSFALMRINLNSLIHSVDDSEFQNYCNLKIRNLDKQLNSIQIKSNYNSNYKSNIFEYISNNFETKNKINTDSNIKSFLKPDNDESENQILNKFKRYSLNELIELNKNQKFKKRKLDYNKILDTAFSINNDNNLNNKTFSYNTYNNNYDDDTYEKKLNKFENKLNEIKNSFLKNDKTIITTISNNKNKNDFKNEIFSRGYNTTKNKTIDNIRIKNKIEENLNYLNKLYPNKKK